MIIANTIGGLGNQMFQYAAGRALALERGLTLAVDKSDYEWYGKHNGFELDKAFKCQIHFATSVDVKNMLGWQSDPKMRRIFAHPMMKAFRSSKYIIEPHFNYWQKFIEVPEDCFIKGYWQSEKYFERYRTEIRDDFQFSDAISDANARLQDDILKVNAVSLHIRRNDYVANNTHGLCSMDFYRSAIQYILTKTINPNIFVFSDDIHWAQANLDSKISMKFIDHNNGKESFNDMRLMSLCRHHIIANSSFSWWGAWLNPSESKIVVAPRLWFKKAIDTSDLLPNNWVVL